MGAEFSKHVDRLLNEAEVYQLAVQSTFSEYAKLPPESVVGGGGGGGGESAVTGTRAATKEGFAAKRPATAEDDVGSVSPSPASRPSVAAGSPGVEQRYLLEAAQVVIKKVSAKMDPWASRLCLRPPTKRDCEYVLFLFPSLAASAFLTPIRNLCARGRQARGRGQGPETAAVRGGRGDDGAYHQRDHPQAASGWRAGGHGG
ncbi:unnamed protein product [Closterium sp. Yama58-4]|nr:unnamed protein product [Closterium sp. Yama58-4]